MIERKKTDKLSHLDGKEVRVNYNVAQDVSKPSVLISGKLLVTGYAYQVSVSLGTWIYFTDENVSIVWENEYPVYIELK